MLNYCFVVFESASEYSHIPQSHIAPRVVCSSDVHFLRFLDGTGNDGLWGTNWGVLTSENESSVAKLSPGLVGRLQSLPMRSLKSNIDELQAISSFPVTSIDIKLHMCTFLRHWLPLPYTLTYTCPNGL